MFPMPAWMDKDFCILFRNQTLNTISMGIDDLVTGKTPVYLLLLHCSGLVDRHSSSGTCFHRNTLKAVHQSGFWLLNKAFRSHLFTLFLGFTVGRTCCQTVEMENIPIFKQPLCGPKIPDQKGRYTHAVIWIPT
jgi:hypothetical protein